MIIVLPHRVFMAVHVLMVWMPTSVLVLHLIQVTAAA